ncbi:hypothetical protein ABPG75_004956 [Micractinium tetrahymenae]
MATHPSASPKCYHRPCDNPGMCAALSRLRDTSDRLTGLDPLDLSRSSRMAATVSLPAARAAQLPRRSSARRVALVVRASALPEQFTGKQFSLLSTSEDATGRLAGLLAAEMRAGDAFCLKGDQGGGKTTFSRAFVRAASGNPGLEVPRPPVSLQPAQYEGMGLLPAVDDKGPLPVLHMDVGGLPRPSDEECQRLQEMFPGAVSLIEWAETLWEWGAAPEQRLALYFRRLPSSPDSDARLITVVPHTGWWEVRIALLQANLSRSGMEDGLVVLGDDMAAQLTAGLPECAPVTV